MRIIFTIALAAVMVFGIKTMVAHAVNVTTPPAAITMCAEDDPCWDCQTMGNHVCGTGTQEAVAPLEP